METEKLASPTGNIYRSVSIISKRANQLTSELKEELSKKLAEFAPAHDNLEEIIENREQIEISRHYERRPKPVQEAAWEFFDGKIYWRNPHDPEDTHTSEVPAK
jgi:DNA-directed RNA polymerase subunit K/omega